MPEDAHTHEAGPGRILPPPPRLDSGSTAADVVARALRRHVGRLVRSDPHLRRNESTPSGRTPVHQMRVACRRLRSDLRTFRPLLDPAWADGLRAGAGWLAGSLGAARDAEVLHARLHRTAAQDPVAPLDSGAVAHIAAMLTARHDAARHALDETVAGPRYTTLLDDLVDGATAPRFTAAAREPAVDALPLLVAGPWRRLATSGRGRIGAGDLDPAGPDDDWHDVRIRGKRARYAVEAVAKVLGGEAVRLAVALGAVQELLGEHQDAAVAADTWLVAAHAEPGLGVTVGRLVERERRSVRRVRELFPAAWAAAADKGTSGWLAR